MAQISFTQGIVRTHATALSFTDGNSAIKLDGQSSPIQLNFADGPDDNYFWEEATLVDPAWTDLPTSNDYWLYIDIDALSAERTFGITTLEPLAQTNTPSNPSDDQHWFDTRSTQTAMKVWTKTKWVQKIRIFMARVNGLTIFDFPEGTQVGLNNSVLSGKLMYDNENKTQPIKQFDRRGRGKFVTTESHIFVQFSNISGFKVAQSIVEGTAIETIPEHHAVAYRGDTDPNKIRELGLARNGTSQTNPRGPFTAVGISTEDFVTGETRTFVTTGYLTDDNFNWTEEAGTYIFVGPTGELVTTVPQFGSVQRIGTVVDQYTILVDIQPIIIYG